MRYPAVFSIAIGLLGLDPSSVQQAPPPNDPVALEDVLVTGQPLQRMIRDFVGSVAEPNRNRPLARWDGEICVGVANLRNETAQYMVDRISSIAADIGLEVDEPGCVANILVVATADAGTLTDRLVKQRRRAFLFGGAGTDRGHAAFRDFIEVPRPVRWWQGALPVDSMTGERAVRLPGDCASSCIADSYGSTSGEYAPNIKIYGAARLKNQIVDNITKTIVIVDVDQIDGVSVAQLSDYIAMVSLAQIDPGADTARYASILNVFSDPDPAPALTDWDTAYLRGLYNSERGSAVIRADRSQIVDAIRREHVRLTSEAEPH